MKEIIDILQQIKRQQDKKYHVKHTTINLNIYGDGSGQISNGDIFLFDFDDLEQFYIILAKWALEELLNDSTT